MSLPEEDGYNYGSESASSSEKRLRQTLNNVAEEHLEDFVMLQEDDSDGLTEILLGGKLRSDQPDQLVDISITLLKFGEFVTTTISAHDVKYEIVEDNISYASEPLRFVSDAELAEIDFWLEQADWGINHSERIAKSMSEFDNLSA